MQEQITSVDIGTTKICVLTAAVSHDSLGNLTLNILGEGQAPSRGIRRGVVMDVSEVTQAVSEAVEKCEQNAGRPVSSAYVGIAGSHIQTQNSRGMSRVDFRSGVTNNDMQSALENARAMSVPSSQEVIHTIARYWRVDGQSSIQNPMGMRASQLEVDAHIVMGSRGAVDNLIQCILVHGIDIDELVLEPLASNEAVLHHDERRMGVAVVDIGGGTTDIAVFRDDSLCHSTVLDVGGNHLTNDIAIGLHTSFETAEDLKLRYGHVQPERIAPDEQVWTRVFGEKNERSFSRRFISEVLEARTEEIVEIIRDAIRDMNYLDKLPAGIVLTGGASQLAGMVDLSRTVMGMPVRIGLPTDRLPITSLGHHLQSPSYATSAGLLLWGLHEDARALHRRYGNQDKPNNGDGGQWTKWLRNLLP